MTREEAIKQLALLIHQCGMLMPISWIKENGGDSPLVDAVCMAVNALREQEERSKGCDFCREDNGGFYRMIGSFYLTNPFHKGEYYLNGGGRKPRKIEYCPMCGRKLEVEK